MALQSLVWTALPNGFTPDGAGLRVSAMLSPRLDPQAPGALPGKLGAFFPDWEDWPKTLGSARFDISYGGATASIPALTGAGPNRIDTTLGSADSQVWKALFGAGTPVIGFTYRDLSPSVMVSYDTVAIAEAIERLYRDLARSAADRLPRVTELIETERWRGFIRAVQSLDEASVDPHTGSRQPQREFDALRRGSRLASDPLANFQRFHTPPAASTVRSEKRKDDGRIEARWREHRRAGLPTKEAIADTIDFHKIVAAMGSYPTLLRRLGLVVDLVVDRGRFAPAAAADLTVKAVFPVGALQIARTSDGVPATRSRLSATRFDAVPDAAAGTAVIDGLLDVQPARFGLLQVDVDGAGLKVMNFARSLGRRFDVESRVDPVTRQEEEIGAPALRTAGLMLVQRERAGILADRFDANKTRNAQLEAQLAGAPGTVTLHAQDLVRGYRIDIWDSVAGRWQSLCRRTARYQLGAPSVAIDVPEEESTIRLAATRSSDETASTDLLYLHEALVSWSGWSLAARPPGRAIGIVEDKVDKTRDDSEAEAPPGIAFKSSFAPVKGSLPRLRFGRSYWIRARAVDLAGNSLAPQPHDFGSEHPTAHARPYLRYEPVAAPVLALLSRAGGIERPLEGESMGRVAIRSFNDTPGDNFVPSAQVAHRVATPPWVSVRDAEQHGKLDAGGKLDSTLFDLLANRKDVDPRDPSAAVREEKLLSQGPLESAPTLTRYAVYESGRALTYLPDPLAAEVAVRVFDHPRIADSEIIRIPLYAGAAWPEARPFEIEVYDDALEAPNYDAATHRLRVPLPKAARARLRLSMTLPTETLPLLGVFQWLTPADQAAQQQRALDGQHWMLTPWTVIEVVHAVQRPLLDPEFIALSIMDRASGQTSAFPVAQIRCNVDSTERLDLYGEWHEPNDDPSLPGPEDQHRRDVAFHVKVTDPAQYRTDSVAPGTPDHTLTTTDVVALNSGGGHDRVARKAHEFHDTRYRRIEYWLDASSRFREFLPTELLTAWDGGKRVTTDAHIKVTGRRRVTWVPNSAPPPAAPVLYVIPTFSWRRQVDAEGNLSSWRRGGGLRVYLDRGWNASGYGEMLGVVLPPKGFAEDPEAVPSGAPYKKYVTLWGNDPVWDSAFVPGMAPTLADFPLARTAPDPTGAWLPASAPPDERDQPPGSFTVSSLPTSGVQPRGGRVDVAPHDVFYDDERRLWYCDIEINTGASYFPFIRLALARYQPTSSPGAHLSNVVLSDIIAVAPDRWVNVTPLPNSRSVRVALFGAGYDESSGHRETSRTPAAVRLDPATGRLRMAGPAEVSATSVVEVWLERLDVRWGEDFGWQRVGDALVTQRTPAQAAAPFPAPVRPESLFGSAASAEAHLRSTSLLSGNAAKIGSALATAISLWRTLWEGAVTLPADGEGRYRLVVAEHEEYVVDDSRPYDRTPTQKGHRTVFIEKIEIG